MDLEEITGNDVPPGLWGVAVSGGADSVALLLLLHGRPELLLHVVHLDHQIRGQASADDAEFVAKLAEKLGIPATIVRRDQIEPGILSVSLPKNPSARYRAIRLELFRRVVEREKLHGVILAHQADDRFGPGCVPLHRADLLRVAQTVHPPGGIGGAFQVAVDEGNQFHLGRLRHVVGGR